MAEHGLAMASAATRDVVAGNARPAGWWALGAARIALGTIFLWAFLDKLFGWNFATPAARSVLSGGSPTKGYLSSATGPLASMFQAMAGNLVTDFLFMAGLCGVGLALLLGIGQRIATVAGVLMLTLMYVSHPPWASTSSNPIVDDHVVYAFTLCALLWLDAGHYLGLGGAWRKTALVRKAAWLA